MSKKPWKDVPHIWKDEKAYLNWLRGQVRRMWSRAPIKIEYKNSRRYKAPVGRNGREVWVSDCEICGCQARKTQVDHIDGGYGFTDWGSFLGWLDRILLIDFDDIRELCIPCHEIVTLSQRKEVSFEEAKIEKEVIAFTKLSIDKQKEILNNEGFSELETSNAKKRRECYSKLLRNEDGTK